MGFPVILFTFAYMKRIFHARITWYQYLYMVFLGLLSFWLLWQRVIIPATLCMLLIVFLIERLIHTTYAITADDKLEIYHGRFSKTRIIKLDDIISIQQRQSPLGRLTKTGYLLLEYGNGKYVSLLPIKEQEFIELLTRRKVNNK